MTEFFGFAIADSMFPPACRVERVPVSVEAATKLAPMCVPVLNPSHQATISAMNVRFGIEVVVPASAPQVTLKKGDSVLVMSARGLPRLEGRHEYTAAEIAAATFAFGIWKVL